LEEQRKKQADEERRAIEEKARVKRERDEEMLKIEAA